MNAQTTSEHFAICDIVRKDGTVESKYVFDRSKEEAAKHAVLFEKFPGLRRERVAVETVQGSYGFRVCDGYPFPYALQNYVRIDEKRTIEVKFGVLTVHRGASEGMNETRTADGLGHAFALADSFDRGEDYDEMARKRNAAEDIEAAFSALVAIEDAAARIRTERTANAMMESADEMRAALAQIVLDDFGEDVAERLDERHEACINDMGADLVIDTIAIAEVGDFTEWAAERLASLLERFPGRFGQSDRIEQAFAREIRTMHQRAQDYADDAEREEEQEEEHRNAARYAKYNRDLTIQAANELEGLRAMNR